MTAGRCNYDAWYGGRRTARRQGASYHLQQHLSQVFILVISLFPNFSSSLRVLLAFHRLHRVARSTASVCWMARAEQVNQNRSAVENWCYRELENFLEIWEELSATQVRVTQMLGFADGMELLAQLPPNKPAVAASVVAIAAVAAIAAVILSFENAGYNNPQAPYHQFT